MDGCPATGLIYVDDQLVGVICNLPPHQGRQHHDNVHGGWDGEEQQ